MTFPIQRELDHIARWISIYRAQKNRPKAEEWQRRWDELYDQQQRVIAIAADGEPIRGDQSPWVADQANMVVHNTDMTDSRLDDGTVIRPGRSWAVNRTGRTERVIRRVMGQRPDDDGDDPKPVPV